MNDPVVSIIEAHKALLLDFLDWVEKNWTLEPSDKWPHLEPIPSEEYRNGYNAAIEGLKGAFDCYYEENMY